MLRFKVTEDKPLTTNTNGTASTYCKIGEREYARCSPWQSIHPPGGQCGYTDPTLGCVGGSHLPPTPVGAQMQKLGTCLWVTATCTWSRTQEHTLSLSWKDTPSQVKSPAQAVRALHILAGSVPDSDLSQELALCKGGLRTDEGHSR